MAMGARTRSWRRSGACRALRPTRRAVGARLRRRCHPVGEPAASQPSVAFPPATRSPGKRRQGGDDAVHPRAHCPPARAIPARDAVRQDWRCWAHCGVKVRLVPVLSPWVTSLS